MFNVLLHIFNMICLEQDGACQRWEPYVFIAKGRYYVIKCGRICPICIRGLLEKYPTFGREKETGLPGALDT